MRALVAGVLAVSACAQAQPALKPPPVAAPSAVSQADAARAALTRFVDAAEARDFEAAWGLLSSKWRGRYTPERLQQDFALEPQAGERLRRIRLGLALPIEVTGETARLTLTPDRIVVLALEAGAWRVAALE